MLVLMCGISGSGKTTIARRLEKQGFERLSLDAIMWERHNAAYMNLPFEKQCLLQAEAERELVERLQRLLAADRDVVVDSCLCKRSHRDAYREIVRKWNTQCKVIYCSAPAEELRRRLHSRISNEGPDCAIVTDEMLNRFLKGFETPQADETDIVSPEDF